MYGSPPEGTEVIWSMYKVSMCALLNAELPIYVTFGKLTVDNAEQLEKALLATYEHNGKLTDVSEKHSPNA